MRLEGKTAVIVGAGQSPGEGVGNGRAVAMLFAKEGARVLCVDRDADGARETAEIIRNEGGTSDSFAADVTDEAALEGAIERCVRSWSRIDILHNNVGISVAGGDASPTEITIEAFDRIMAVNLRGTVMACKHALATHARAAQRRHRQHLLDCRHRELSVGGLQGQSRPR